MNETTMQELRGKLRGEVITPADPTYDTARKVYNGMIDKRPSLIACCVDEADVIAAVQHGRESHLLTAVRGGGHNGGGLGICDGGLVIDLSRMKGIRVDPAARTVRVQGGCTGGDMDHATHAFGMATPGGTVSTTGVAGLTLGGGIGHLTRPYGLAIDNLLGVDMVLADGRLVTASATENPDLFWAVRGGGGNFGVVTSFLFRLHPVSTVTAGPTFWPIDQTPTVMKAYGEFIRQAPEDISGFFAFLTVPPVPLFPPQLHGKKVCAVVWCSTASPETADKATKAMRSVGKPLLDHVGPMPFPALQSLFDPLLPPGLQWYWRADFVKELGDAAIAQHAPPPNFGLVMGDHRRPGIEGQEQLGEAGRLAGRAPEASHQPRRGKEGRRVGERLVGDQDRIAGDDPALEPEPLARRERGDVREQRVGGLTLGNLEDPG